jgi:NIPSNAP
MKNSHLLSFLAGAALMLCASLATHNFQVPAVHAQSTGAVYELRIYHSPAGKLDALKARFRDHTIGIFNRFNMQSVGYFTPQDNPDNLLIYVLKHPSRAEGEKNWASFNADPEWKKVLAESQVNGPLQTKVERTWMDPADFSPLK